MVRPRRNPFHGRARDDSDVLTTILAQPRYGVGRILVSCRDRHGRTRQTPPFGWLDAEEGRFLVDTHSNDDQLITTYTPASRSGLAQRIRAAIRAVHYIRAVHQAAHPDATEAACHRAVDLRQARQLRLPERNITALINEAAVRRIVGGPAVMRAQLDYLLNVVHKDTATVQIVPFSAGAHPAMSGPFHLLKFPDVDEIDLVYTDNERGGIYLERPEDLVRYTDVFTRTQQLALSPEKSGELIGKIIAEL